MAGKQVQVVNPVPPAQRENNYSMAEQSRINSLEDRLINQERAAQSILGEYPQLPFFYTQKFGFQVFARKLTTLPCFIV